MPPDLLLISQGGKELNSIKFGNHRLPILQNNRSTTVAVTFHSKCRLINVGFHWFLEWNVLLSELLVSWFYDDTSVCKIIFRISSIYIAEFVWSGSTHISVGEHVRLFLCFQYVSNSLASYLLFFPLQTYLPTYNYLSSSQNKLQSLYLKSCHLG